MNTILLITSFVILMVIEMRIIDPLFWRSGKSDKPWSTLIAGGIMIIAGLLVQFVFHLNWALSVIFLAFTLRVGLFDYLYAMVYRKPWNYLGENPTDQWKYTMGIARYPAEAFCLLVGILQYLYFDCTVYDQSANSILFDLPRFCQ